LSAIELTQDTQPDERTGALAGPTLHAAARTHRGAVRAENQDAFLCRPDLGVFAVIDGMGGERAGRRAAELAREALEEKGDPARGLLAANERIRTAAQNHPELSGMGCVASALKITDGVAHVAHVGDTRVYLACSAGCEQLTRDHTVAASEQERLALSHQDAGGLPGRNQVTRDLGGKRRRGQDWIDRLEVPLEQGALLLLCSDGLPEAVGTDHLFERLRQARRAGKPPEEVVDELIALALERGARDNVTALIVRHDGEAPGPHRNRRLPVREVWPAVLRAVPPFLVGAVLGFLLRGWVGF
jgi:protein phosphatase